MISIIDYGAGNLNSVEKAVRFLGFECTVTGDKDEMLCSDITGRFMTLWRKRFPF